MTGAYSVTLYCHSVIIEFPFIISARVAYIQLKFDIWIHHRNMQVKFENGHGPMIFDRVILLEGIFRSLTFVVMHVWS
jgi:hypothetical protein